MTFKKEDIEKNVMGPKKVGFYVFPKVENPALLPHFCSL
jgi:hypothetical protein